MAMGDYNVSTTVAENTSWSGQFGTYPIIYPLTLYYIYPVIVVARVVHVIWYVIGGIGNVLSMKIWTNPRMKRVNSSALYLVCITVCDITYQILHVFAYLKYFWGLPSIGYPGLCQIWNILNMIPQYANQLLVLGFTVERFISVICPFKGERFSKHDRAPKEVTVIFVFVVLAATPQAYLWTVNGRGFCELRESENLLSFYTIWSFVTETALFLLVPVVTLFLNIFVLRETRRSLKSFENFNRSDRSETRVHRKSKNYRPATITLLCISFFRILTQLPVSITFSMQNMDEFEFGQMMPIEEMQYDAQWRNFFKYWGARIVIEAIGASHYALSVFIFYFSTKQYRLEVTKLCSKLKAMVLKQKTDNSPEHTAMYGVRGSMSKDNTYISDTVKL